MTGAEKADIIIDAYIQGCVMSGRKALDCIDEAISHVRVTIRHLPESALKSAKFDAIQRWTDLPF